MWRWRPTKTSSIYIGNLFITSWLSSSLSALVAVLHHVAEWKFDMIWVVYLVTMQLDSMLNSWFPVNDYDLSVFRRRLCQNQQSEVPQASRESQRKNPRCHNSTNTCSALTVSPHCFLYAPVVGTMLAAEGHTADDPAETRQSRISHEINIQRKALKALCHSGFPNERTVLKEM